MSMQEANRKSGLVVMALAVTIALVAPTASIADKHEKPAMADPAANHFKCYQVLDWTVWDPKKVELKDQFGASVAGVMEPYMLCNPVDKNGEGIADKDNHLVCYRIQDDPQGNYERVKEVQIRNQFHETALWVGSGQILCVPSDKRYDPRG